MAHDDHEYSGFAKKIRIRGYTPDAEQPGQAAADRGQAKRFMDAFGPELGFQYFAAGLSMVEAQARFTELKLAQNRALKKQLGHAKQQLNAAGIKPRVPGKGFASRIRIAG